MTPLRLDRWDLCPGDARGDAQARLSTQGDLSVCFLTTTMARVSWRRATGYLERHTWAIAPTPGEDVPWSGRPRESLQGFDRPTVVADGSGRVPCLETSRLRVELRGDDDGVLRLAWHDPDTQQAYLTDRETSAYLCSERTGATRHCVVRDPAEHYYGLGDKTGPLNLHGRRLRCLGQDSLGYDPEKGDPLYKHWPFLMHRTTDGLWAGVYYDTLSACTFDLGCEHDNYHDLFRSVDIDDGDLDYYLMVGNTPSDVVAQFVQLIGGTALPPRWSVGFALTAMGLADAPDAQIQLGRFIERCQAEAIPISAFHYGSGYSTRGKQRYVFTWNASKFPDPIAINQQFKAAGMRLVANIKPCLLDDHPAYASVAARGGFIREASTGNPVVEPFWDGRGAYLDFTAPDDVAWWQAGLRTQILEKGIDAGWNDNNEYAIQSEQAQSAGWGQAIPLHRSRPLHGLLMTRATYEAQQSYGREHGRDEAVFTVTRAGPPGLQRYAQTWSGDNTTSWATLRWNIRTGLQMSLSGMFNVGHDVGGFFGPSPDPEMFCRWVQACALNPRMVMNSWKADGCNNVPWMHPSVTGAVREAIALRYRLMPYLWQCFENACAHHVPIIRPSFFNFPDDLTCLDDCDDFMLGTDLLVAPVVNKGDRTRTVYLPVQPDGQGWVNFYTRAVYAGGQLITDQAPLDRLPLWVRQGAKIGVSETADGRVARYDDGLTDYLYF